MGWAIGVIKRIFKPNLVQKHIRIKTQNNRHGQFGKETRKD